MGSLAASRAAPRAIHGWALRSCIVGLTLAVNLEAARGQFRQSITIKFAVRVDAAAHLPERVLAPAATAALLVGKVGPTDRVDLADTAGKADLVDTADMAGKVAGIADSLAGSLLGACHS